MANSANDQNQILDFYNAGVENERLNRGIGKLEFERSKEIISRYLTQDNMVIYDVGGGTGVYSRWLAELGHQVHLLELSPNNVEFAKEVNKRLENPVFSIEMGNAMNLKKHDESADIVLLMGPLYHLIDKNDRIKALVEAKRVLKKHGILITAAISRYGSALWGLSVYGKDNDVIDDEIFLGMIKREMKDGQHIRPEEYPYFIARAFFHLPGELKEEIESAGFCQTELMAVEGPVWIAPGFEEKWDNDFSRKRLLEICKTVETHESLMGMSPHLLVIAMKE